MTSDVSKLVNLKTLQLEMTKQAEHIPESISCLQNLEHLAIDAFEIQELPPGLAKLETLVTLHMTNRSCLLAWALRLPDNLQVIGRKHAIG